MASRVNNETRFPIVCSDCGKKDFVNFSPTPGRKIFCKECLRKRRMGKFEGNTETFSWTNPRNRSPSSPW